MNRLEAIAARKQALIERSDAGRYEIVRLCYQYQARTLFARQATRIFKNPLFLAGAGLFAWKWPWRRTFKFGGWAWRAFRLMRTVRRFML